MLIKTLTSSIVTSVDVYKVLNELYLALSVGIIVNIDAKYPKSEVEPGSQAWHLVRMLHKKQGLWSVDGRHPYKAAPTQIVACPIMCNVHGLPVSGLPSASWFNFLITDTKVYGHLNSYYSASCTASWLGSSITDTRSIINQTQDIQHYACSIYWSWFTPKTCLARRSWAFLCPWWHNQDEVLSSSWLSHCGMACDKSRYHVFSQDARLGQKARQFPASCSGDNENESSMA